MFLDIDECKTSPCSMSAICNNNIGSYSCKCKDVFSGNGKNCTGINDLTNQLY